MSMHRVVGVHLNFSDEFCVGSYRLTTFPPGVKRPGREANHSLQSSTEVKNAWSYTSTPSVRLRGVVFS